MEHLREYIDYGIVAILGAMSVAALGIVIERLAFMKKVDVSAFGTKQELETALTKGLHNIGSIASNAPYIGLLGTVLGIMATFYTMGNGGMGDVSAVMKGLSSALFATACGLVVAIPTVYCYNLLIRRSKEKLTEWIGIHGRERD